MYRSDVLHPRPSLQEKLRKIYDLRRGSTAINLHDSDPYMTLLDALGNPHLHIPPCIHVAGTNGKGSVLAYIDSIMQRAGYKTHRYSSPHLLRFNERVTLRGCPIDDDMLDSLLDEVLAVNAGAALTFFEITTALAFLAFSRHEADLVLLETGLGGRLDCTNVVPSPLATVITRIGYDHMEFLGDDIAAIAAEKAGIIKPGRPVIVGHQHHEPARREIVNMAAARGAPLYDATENFLPATSIPSLTGAHQRENAMTALCCVTHLDGFTVAPRHIEQGLAEAVWPARLQNITSLLAGSIPPGCEVWLDGGHNESAAQILAAQARHWQEQDQKPLYLVLGMMRHKDVAAFAAPLLPVVREVFCTGIAGEPAAFTADDLAAAVKAAGAVCPVTAVPDKNLPARLEPHSRYLVTGSLYLAQCFLKNV